MFGERAYEFQLRIMEHSRFPGQWMHRLAGELQPHFNAATLIRKGTTDQSLNSS